MTGRTSCNVEACGITDDEYRSDDADECTERCRTYLLAGPRHD